MDGQRYKSIKAMIEEANEFLPGILSNIDYLLDQIGGPMPIPQEKEGNHVGMQGDMQTMLSTVRKLSERVNRLTTLLLEQGDENGVTKPLGGWTAKKGDY